jgi:hypothetical protein
VLALHPLDVIKTRLQGGADNHSRFMLRSVSDVQQTT